MRIRSRQKEEVAKEIEEILENTPVLTSKEAARYLRVSTFTLSRMDKDILPARTPGGHRRYTIAMLNEYLQGSRRGGKK